MFVIKTHSQIQAKTELDVALRLHEAINAHRQNKFTEAERGYNAILSVEPDCFDALHFLGVVYLQQNKLPEALELASRALQAKPESADSLAMRGVVLSHLGRYAEALESHDALLLLRPDSADTHYNRGVALDKLGRYEEAVESYRRSIALNPNKPQVFHNLGNSLIELGRPQEALEAYEGRLGGAAPAGPDTLINRANVLLELKRFDEALESYDCALAIAQDNTLALLGRGHALRELKRNADALACYEHVLALDSANLDAMEGKAVTLGGLERHADALASCDVALALAPDRVGILNTRCVALQKLGRLDEAVAAATHMLSVDENNATAYFNLGNVQQTRGLYEEAEAAYRKSIELAPDTSEVHTNLGGTLLAQGQHDSALDCYGRALELGAPSDDTRTNRGLVYLGLGNFKRGWVEYQRRFKTDQVKCWRDYQVPLWDGAALNGPLVVWGEQGLGDQILYASMIPDLTARVSSTILEAETRLVSLFARSFPDVEVITSKKPLYCGPQAAHIPLGTLGLHLRTSWESFPKTPGGFLKADPEQAAALRARLKTDDRLVVGISWRSSNKKLEKAKSAGLHAFAPLLKLRNCRFVDLQYGDTSAERAAVARDIGVEIEHLDDIDNFSDIDGLAALITACDLVVTVSNTTAHLAGALGNETYVLVPFGQARMWYWFHDRTDSPFYPDVKIRRQAKTHDWVSLMAPLADEIGRREGG